MDYLKQKEGFLGYEADPKIDNKVVVVPFGLERSVSYGGGTKNGPKEIIKASHQVELFDEDLNKEPYKDIGIKTLKPFSIKKNLKSAIDQLGSINKKKAGTWGLFGAFSLHPLKNINVWSDGGIITTNNLKYYKQLKLLRNHGLVNRDTVKINGYNSRLDTFQAVVGNWLLPKAKKIAELIEIAEVKTAGVYENIVNQAIFEALFKNKYDGCYERPEYSYLKVFKKGSTHNCFRVRHSDVYKELYAPDDQKQVMKRIKSWIKKK